MESKFKFSKPQFGDVSVQNKSVMSRIKIWKNKVEKQILEILTFYKKKQYEASDIRSLHQPWSLEGESELFIMCLICWSETR